MQLYLRYLMRRDYINGTITKPTDPNALEIWEEADITAQLTISFMVQPNIIHLVFEVHSTEDAWKAL